MTKSRDAVRQFAFAMRDRTGNQPPLPAIFLISSLPRYVSIGMACGASLL